MLRLFFFTYNIYNSYLYINQLVTLQKRLGSRVWKQAEEALPHSESRIPKAQNPPIPVYRDHLAPYTTHPIQSRGGNIDGVSRRIP